MFIFAPAPVSVSSTYGLESVAYADDEVEFMGIPEECVDECLTYTLAEARYQIASTYASFRVPDFAWIAATKDARA